MQKRVDIYDTVARSPQGDACGDACADCATWFEKTNGCCGWRVKRWLVCFALLSLMGVGFRVLFEIYAVRFGEATSCRLTYADDAVISEAEMQNWMADERWPLSVPTYDWKRRTCVCKGFEDKDPKSLLPTDEVLVWIAPGDLVSLSDEGKLAPRLPTSFLDEYRGIYGEKDHVKVCLQQQYVLNLWNLDPSTINAMDGGRHCHVSSSDGSSNVEQFFLGWDGALYCESQCPAGEWNPIDLNWKDPSVGRTTRGVLNSKRDVNFDKVTTNQWFCAQNRITKCVSGQAKAVSFEDKGDTTFGTVSCLVEKPPPPPPPPSP